MDVILLVEIIFIAGVVSFIMGAMGFGGGGYWTILLIFFFGVPVETAIGTSLALSAITSTTAVAEHWRIGNIDKYISVELTVYGAVGTVGGAYLIQYLSPDLLKYIIVIIFVLVGLLSLIRTKKLNKSNQTEIKRKSKLIPPMGFFMGLIGEH